MADSDRIINHEDGQGIKEAIDGITTAVKDSISFNIGNGNAPGSVQTKNSRAVGENSFAEGNSYAQGVASHAEGDSHAYGDYSHAEGRSSIANGKSSHAGGDGSIASGENAFAHGDHAKAAAEGSFAFGENIETTSSGQFAIGNDIKADPAATFVVAHNGESLFEVMRDGRAKVSAAPKEDDDVVRKADVLKLSSDLNLDNGTGEGSLKMKSPSAVASGDYSLAIGREPKASGESSVAIGYQASASGDNSVAIGYQASASGHNSVAVGENVKNQNSNTIAVGRNFTNDSDITFVVGKDSATLLEVSGESTSVHGNLYVDDDVTIHGKLTANEYTVVQAKSVDTERYTIGLAKGNTEEIASYVGLYATNYDGRNTGALVWDSTGTAYVGDASVDGDGKITDPSGALQPLMTRDAESELDDKCFFIWDASKRKAVKTHAVEIVDHGTIIKGGDGGAYMTLYSDGKYAQKIILGSSLYLIGDGSKAFFGEAGAKAENFSPSEDYDFTTKKYVDDNFVNKQYADSNYVDLSTVQTIVGEKRFAADTYFDKPVQIDKYLKTDEIDNTSGNALVRYKSAEAKNVFGGVNYDAVIMGKSDRPYYSKDGTNFSGAELALKSDIDGITIDGGLLNEKYLRLDGTNAMTGNFVLKDAVTIDAYDATNTTKTSIVHVINDNHPRIFFGGETYKAYLKGSESRPYYLTGETNITEIALLSDAKPYTHTVTIDAGYTNVLLLISFTIRSNASEKYSVDAQSIDDVQTALKWLFDKYKGQRIACSGVYSSALNEITVKPVTYIDFSSGEYGDVKISYLASTSGPAEVTFQILKTNYEKYTGTKRFRVTDVFF